MGTRALLFGLSIFGLTCTGAQAAEMSVVVESGGPIAVKVTSLFEKRFRGTIKQQYDFSCGSAALATLLSRHFEHPVGEEDVFQAMFEAGDKDKIRAEGFSLLDMKRYLERAGYQADGYKMPLSAFEDLRVPAIALINEKGYKHFVVIKGIGAGRVLLGDPAVGTRTVTAAEFEAMHTGIYFLIRNKKDVAQANFNQLPDWRANTLAPLASGVSRDALGAAMLLLPNRYDF